MLFNYLCKSISQYLMKSSSEYILLKLLCLLLFLVRMYVFFHLPTRCLFTISGGFLLLQLRHPSVLWIATVMALFTNYFPSSVITLSICGLICNHVWAVPPSSFPFFVFLSLFVSSAFSTSRPFNLTGFSPNENFFFFDFSFLEPSLFMEYCSSVRIPSLFPACIRYEIFFIHQIIFCAINFHY